MAMELNRFEEMRKLLRLPSYRLRLMVFVLFGLCIFLISAAIENPSWHTSLMHFGVAFSAVGLVSFMWDFLGGDPLERKFSDSFTDLDGKVSNLYNSMTALSELLAVGIERLWPSRSVWEKDPIDGLSVWQKRVCEAKLVDIVSNTFWTRWMHNESFRQSFFKSLKNGTAARILIYDPDAPVLSERAADERDPSGQMQNEIRSTLVKLALHLQRLGGLTVLKNLHVALTNKHPHYAQIIRADERMLVAFYLSGKTGSPSPTLQLNGSGTAYFLTYMEQISILWGRGHELDDAAFADILQSCSDD